jgi:carbamoyl-phosphate synthase large subunit
MATKIMLGKSLDELGLKEYKEPKFAAVKEVVFPFLKLQGVIPQLGPEMKSTGEVMGIDSSFDKAFFKAQAAAGTQLPSKGRILMSVGTDEDKLAAVPIAEEFIKMGFKLYCTRSTSDVFKMKGIDSVKVPKIRDDPLTLDLMKGGMIQLVVNIHRGSHPKSDSSKINSLEDYHIEFNK